MIALRLQVASGESLIKIGSNIKAELSAALQGSIKAMIITDNNIAALYDSLISEIKENNKEVDFSVFALPSGEGAKTLATHGKIVNVLAEQGFTRSDCIISIGGGVVSDIAGFVAATYMRGVRYISIPTTLLAMVDASIGGKCGVNLEAGKNLVGCFYQPELILVDASFLSTLSSREYNCGIAEIIKYGVIADKSIFSLLDNADANIDKLIYKSIKIKIQIVQADEKESFIRMQLNFGHTIGHIVEKVGGYSSYSHGEAVAYGMVMEAKLLALAGLASDKGVIGYYTNKFGLNITPTLDKNKVAENIFSDKKMRGNQLFFAGFSEIGQGKVFEFSKKEMLRLIDMLFEEV